MYFSKCRGECSRSLAAKKKSKNQTVKQLSCLTNRDNEIIIVNIITANTNAKKFDDGANLEYSDS